MEITGTIKKRTAFYGYMTQMSPTRCPTGTLLTSRQGNQGSWFTDVERDIKEVGITCEDIQEHEPIKKKFKAH